MSTSVPPIDAGAFTGLKQGDERTLERLFRERYAPLCAEAKSTLGDDASSARVVESTFVRAWRERDGFDTPESLDTFLHQTVHESAVRQQSRRAMLHHHEDAKGGGTRATHAAPTVDTAWTHVSEALHIGQSAADIRASGEISKHEIAAHIAEVGKKRSIVIPVVVGLVVAGVIIGGLFWLQRASEAPAITGALAASDTRVISSRPGVLGNVRLDDGSEVVLGPDSKLHIPRVFNERFRAVGLDGSATFKVAVQKEMPFEVRTGNAAVRATGTKFAVRAYPTDADVLVRVDEGTVEVSNVNGGKPRALAAKQAAVVAKDGSLRDATPAELEEGLAWADGRIIIPTRPLRQVLPLITRYYGLQLEAKDSSLLDRPVTVNARLESAKEAIAAIESSGNMKFAYEDKAMVLSDAKGAGKATAKPAKAAPKKKGQ